MLVTPVDIFFKEVRARNMCLLHMHPRVYVCVQDWNPVYKEYQIPWGAPAFSIIEIAIQIGANPLLQNMLGGASAHRGH